MHKVPRKVLRCASMIDCNFRFQRKIEKITLASHIAPSRGRETKNKKTRELNFLVVYALTSFICWESCV
jgi:hypothetical protein